MMFKRLGVLTILIVLALMTSVPAVFAQGQSLATGSIRILPDPEFGFVPADTPIHVDFNARAEYFIEEGTEAFPFPHYEATGHIFWREDGQTIRVSVDMVRFLSGPDWSCAQMSGEVYIGHATRERLCFMVCDDYDTAAAWDNELYLYGFAIDPQRGNVTIKP